MPTDEPFIDPLLTSQDLAAYLNKPISWIYNNAATLPAFRVGRVLRFRRSEVERWLEQHRDGAFHLRR